MSKHEQITIACPKCGKEGEFTMWTSLNTQIDPEAKAKTLSGDLFTFKCPQCGTETNVNNSMLYHQMEDCRMIYYVAENEDISEVERIFQGQFQEKLKDGPLAELMPGMENYVHRIVRSQSSMVEKIKILDDGLDDRIIELLKIVVFKQVKQDQPEFNDCELIYGGKTENLLFWVVGPDKNYGGIEVPMESYDGIKAQFVDMLPDITSKNELIIDSTWAEDKLVEQYHKSEGKRKLFGFGRKK